MKNQYFGDVNDYVKYGLLRCLAEAGWQVGVWWMLTPDDGKLDGRKTSYLDAPEKWSSYDSDLFDVLSSCVFAGARDVHQIEARPELLPGARFYGWEVPDRASEREAWFANGLITLADCDLLFFDPDNGMEVPSIPYGRKNSSKFVYTKELTTAWERGSSLFIFQHFPHVKREVYTPWIAERLRGTLPGSEVAALSSSNVLYLLVVNSQHRTRMTTALDLIAARWGSRVR